MMHKKAIGAYDIVYWSFRILFILIMFSAIIFLARVYENQTIDTSYSEAVIFIRYMLYNPNSLPYVDPESGRAYPGTVDISKFSSAQLESAMSFGEIKDMVTAKISLEYQEENPDSRAAELTKEEIYYNIEKYNQWLPLTSPSLRGVGTVRRIKERKYVLVHDRDEVYPGFIEFDVLVPRT